MQAFHIVQREVDRQPSAYVANVNYALAGDSFKAWITRQVDQRNAKVAQEASMIEMDSQIAQIYQASTAVSGKYHAVRIIFIFLS